MIILNLKTQREEESESEVTQSCLILCDPMDCHTPLSVGFSRQEYWSGLPFPFPGVLPHPGIKPTSPASAGGFFTAEPPGAFHLTLYSEINSNAWTTSILESNFIKKQLEENIGANLYGIGFGNEFLDFTLKA